MAAVLGGRAAAVGREWGDAHRGLDPGRLWERHVAAGVAVVGPDAPGWPEVLRDDPEPPVLLFAQGDLATLAGPRVAVVGSTPGAVATGATWRSSSAARWRAAGVGVVSGLALGIDAAAHAGALEAGARPPVAVVATGLDVVYPRRNGPLWRRVASRGVLLSEYPLGVPPLPWRFPARNRLVAALADVVVVVESHARGGSLYTVDEAARRDRPVLAVPGSVHSPASRGALDLLADGCPGARRRRRADRARPVGNGPVGPATRRIRSSIPRTPRCSTPSATSPRPSSTSRCAPVAPSAP
ncbi:MAG: DNA-processing protein DprA [Acidimicrobiia bacterium]|nr:DNA-processing protein DprA [Acidimicrobiia bacterium]